MSKLDEKKDIKQMAKPLGRSVAVRVALSLRPDKRNPIEGKFRQGKFAYGLDCIKAKLRETSESWIACIALVLNPVNIIRHTLLYIFSVSY